MSLPTNESAASQSGREFEPYRTLIDHDSSVFVGPSVDDDIDGLEMSQAAIALGISVDEVWRRVRNGLILARTFQGKVLVYTDLNVATTQEELTLPPVPPLSRVTENAKENNFRDVPTEVYSVNHLSTNLIARPNQEIALMIDHLSLAKEENREILRLTQDSMARLTYMTDAMLDMKNSIIASKEEQMSILKQRLEEQAADLLRVLKEKEDFETLAKALQDQ